MDCRFQLDCQIRLSIAQTWIVDCPNIDRLDWIVDWIGLDWQPCP